MFLEGRGKREKRSDNREERERRVTRSRTQGHAGSRRVTQGKVTQGHAGSRRITQDHVAMIEQSDT